MELEVEQVQEQVEVRGQVTGLALVRELALVQELLRQTPGLQRHTP